MSKRRVTFILRSCLGSRRVPWGRRPAPPRHRTPGRGPARVDLGHRRSPSVGVVRPPDRDRHRSQFEPVHQLLGSDEAREIPRWLSQRRDEAAPSRGHRDLRAHLAGELDALRQCRAWLERLERGDQVVVNLRPESDPETEYVSFDRPRVLRVPARIIADLDGLAGFPPITEEDVKKGSVEARRARHRRRLAEPDPPAKPLTVQEERAALRALLKLPPSEKG